jgi:hypothetical protein
MSPCIGRLPRTTSLKAFVALPARAVVAALVVVCMLPARGEASSGSVEASSRGQEFILYSVPSQQQYLNNADDRTRGEGNNPFGNYSSTAVPPPPNEELFGPFPGDEGEFAFNLYTGSDLKTSAGSAIFVCQYNFNEDSFCDASLQLHDGTLVGKGASNFNSSRLTLAITGGTGRYRGTKGNLGISALGSATQAQPVRRAVPMLEEQRLALAIGAPSVGHETITAYSMPGQQTFVDNNDDEARGDVNNPFGTHDNKAATIASEHANGPFAGDEALFSFTVYTNGRLTKKGGSAVYTCQYYFAKNAFCDASFQLAGGTVFGAGTLNFNATKFALAITGGSGKYIRTKGDVQVSPLGKQAQRLVFVLG